MKKLIKADTARHISSLEEAAYNIGYNLSVSNGKLTLECIEDAEFMPGITVKVTYEGDKYSYEAILSFPDLDTRRLQYHDDVLHYIKKWSKVGEFVSDLNRYFYIDGE